MGAWKADRTWPGLEAIGRERWDGGQEGFLKKTVGRERAFGSTEGTKPSVGVGSAEEQSADEWGILASVAPQPPACPPSHEEQPLCPYTVSSPYSGGRSGA